MSDLKSDSEDSATNGSFSNKIIQGFRSTYSNEYTFFIVVAILIGFFAGLANFVFVAAYEFVYARVVLPYWGSIAVLIPLLCGGIILFLISFLFSPSEILGFGFPKFLERINLRGGILKPKETFAKVLSSLITLGFGGSAGQEGPIAQLGGSIGSFVGQTLNVSRNKIRVFVACGVAAAIAATFNAPIAGVLFAEEIALLRDFKIRSFIPIVIASAVGTLVSHILRGVEPIFQVPPYNFISNKELFFYALFGILMGIFAAAFIKFFIMTEDSFSKIRLPRRVKPILGGFIVGCMGIFFPYILGNGYQHAEKALLGELSLWIVIGLIILKPIATSITIGSGWSGGIFAPSIFIGAVAGNAFGNLVETIFSSPVELSSSYATVGMGTFLAAVTQAPLTSIFLIFELTQSYEVVIPIMITSVLGWVVTRLIVGGSLEAIELKRAGVDIEEGMEENILRSIIVEDVMSRNVETIPENMPLRKLIEYIPNSRYTTFPLIDGRGLLSGIISIRDFRELIYEESLKDLVVVKELATLNVLTVNENDTLDIVIKRWGRKPVGIIPVVESSDSRKIVGVISSKDVITAYNKSLTDRANERMG